MEREQSSPYSNIFKKMSALFQYSGLPSYVVCKDINEFCLLLVDISLLGKGKNQPFFWTYQDIPCNSFCILWLHWTKLKSRDFDYVSQFRCGAKITPKLSNHLLQIIVMFANMMEHRRFQCWFAVNQHNSWQDFDISNRRGQEGYFCFW